MEETKRPSHPFILLVSLIDRPATALAEIAVYPRWRWVLPLILLLGAMIASTLLTGPLRIKQARQVMQQQLAALPPEQAERVSAQMERFQQPSVLLATSLSTGVIGLLLSWGVASAILYFSVLIAGGELEFHGLFATVPWTWLPFALRDLVQTGYILFRRQLITNPGLSYLVSTGKPLEDAHSLLYNVLARLDLFTLWHLALIFVVLWVVPRFSKGKALLLTAVYAALSLGLRLLPVLLGRAVMPA